jgi:crotonobetainyl-CoA:carnitine CoA-transferase CaiB-like acyl-CoA transferase
MGASALADDPRFRTNADRMGNLPALDEELGRIFEKRPADHWLEMFDAAGVPCGPVLDTLQALSDPQTIARKMLVEVEHSTLGPVKTIGLPVKFSQTPGGVRKGAPIFGEDTRQILADAGFSAEEVAAFERDGAVVAAQARGPAAARAGTAA